MGVTVRQKVKGKGKPWWVFINHNAKRKSMKIGDKKAAQRVASAVREKIAKGELNLEAQKAVPTFGEYSKNWLTGYIKAMRRLSTFQRYQELLENHILPVFAKKPMDKINRGDIRDFLVSKSGQDRKVDMSNQLAAALKDLLTQRKKEALQKGLGEIHELVFHTETGCPIEQNHAKNLI